MPASSRKRNKGKERKAKKEANKAAAIRADANKYWRSFCSTSAECAHGCNARKLPDDHPVSNFIDQFFGNLLSPGVLTVGQNIREIFSTHHHILDDMCHRGLIIHVLKHIGTNMLLRGKYSEPVCLGQSIVMLEEYDKLGTYDLAFNSQRVRSKWRDLQLGSSSNIRDALKFYRRRISACKCLKKMHLEARQNEPKTGICGHCKEEKGRAALSVCSRCMVSQYCSRECQVAAWPEHKRPCDEYSHNYKQQMKEHTRLAAASQKDSK